MEQPTLLAPPEYEIRTVADFLKVPVRRRENCIAEFKDWLALCDSILAALNGDDDPPPAAFSYFRWIDDGRRDIDVVIEVALVADSPK